MTKITIEKFTPYERCPTCWRPNKAVTITEEEYDLLINCQKELSALYDGGVDNWEWYEESLKIAETREKLNFLMTKTKRMSDDEYKSRRHTCDVKEEK